MQIWGSGNAEVYVDAVSIFSAPQPITSQWTWVVGGGNPVRVVDGSHA